MKIISNLAEPDSFEFEIVGEGYDWKDKKEKILLANQSIGVDLKAKFKTYLENNNSKLVKLVKYEVGEGMEKRNDDFAAEVMSQIK